MKYAVLQKRARVVGSIAIGFCLVALIFLIIDWVSPGVLPENIGTAFVIPAIATGCYFVGMGQTDSTIYKSQHKEEETNEQPAPITK